MRIWDIHPSRLCRMHLLGEHRELHAIWVILNRDKKGYSHHPETKRWRGRSKALYLRHQALVEEMARRDYRHGSILNKRLVSGSSVQSDYVDSPREQIKILRSKKCGCRV